MAELVSEIENLHVETPPEASQIEDPPGGILTREEWDATVATIQSLKEEVVGKEAFFIENDPPPVPQGDGLKYSRSLRHISLAWRYFRATDSIAIEKYGVWTEKVEATAKDLAPYVKWFRVFVDGDTDPTKARAMNFFEFQTELFMCIYRKPNYVKANVESSYDKNSPFLLIYPQECEYDAVASAKRRQETTAIISRALKDKNGAELPDGEIDVVSCALCF